MSALWQLPLAVLTDSYKATHAFLYPEAKRMVAYGEFRSGYDNDKTDTRIVFYGIRYIIEHYVGKKWTEDDVLLAGQFFNVHNSGQRFPFPTDLFLKFVREKNGHFPVKIYALPEGTVLHAHVPVYVIVAENEYARLVTFLETILTMIWYPSTVATLSRRAKDLIEASYAKSVDESGMWSLDSRLHDFGFRGCTTVEQSIVGGCAHLLNFTGTDTMSAGYYAQVKLNNGKPTAFSIPATEHSVMTSHKNEREAMLRLLDQFGSGVCACVMDSYDYTAALEKVLPSVKAVKLEKGGFLVLRPDSGDPVEVVIQALRAADKLFGSVVNKKGYKVVNGVGVIQGDGINIKTMAKILQATEEAGYAAQCVAYGMGGGLLQKVNRDTMSFATKLSKIVYQDGTERDVMKAPKTDSTKISLPGEFTVVRNSEGALVVYPVERAPPNSKNILQLVYDHGKVPKWDDFDTIRARVKSEWGQPKAFDPVSKELREKIKEVAAKQAEANLQGV